MKIRPTMEIVTRSRWGSHPLATESKPLELPVKYLVISATGTRRCENVTECKKRLQQIQMEGFTIDNFDDIAHNFLIGGDGRVYEGCGWYMNTTFDLAMDFLEDQAIRIAYIGPFTKDTVPKTYRQVAKRLVRYGIAHNCIRPRYMAIKFPSTLEEIIRPPQ